MSTSNRKYKDSVFVDLFSEDEKAKENFLSLYNALHGTKLTATAQLKNVRLDQVLYMTFYNDVSYLIDNKIIVLVEHQSTINPNMPLRCLEYISRLYETLFESKEKYSRKLLNIPMPEFYVFYNGDETYPSDKTLKLSDAFIDKEVLNMLLAEYDYETDIAVQRAEEREIAFAEGISQGVYQNKLETAKNLAEMGFTVEAIAKATGLSCEEIEKL